MGFVGFDWTNQSSTAFGGTSDKAGDRRFDGSGKIDGNFNNGTVTHTAQQNTPQWWAELSGGITDQGVHVGMWVQYINVYNRTDCCGDRLAGAEVWVHQNKKTNGVYSGSWRKVGTLSGTHAMYTVNIGKSVGNIHQIMISLPKNQAYLSLAEVMVMGAY